MSICGKPKLDIFSASALKSRFLKEKSQSKTTTKKPHLDAECLSADLCLYSFVEQVCQWHNTLSHEIFLSPFVSDFPEIYFCLLHIRGEESLRPIMPLWGGGGGQWLCPSNKNGHTGKSSKARLYRFGMPDINAVSSQTRSNTIANTSWCPRSALNKSSRRTWETSSGRPGGVVFALSGKKGTVTPGAYNHSGQPSICTGRLKWEVSYTHGDSSHILDLSGF